MEMFYYSTQEYHPDNTFTLQDFLENKFLEKFDAESEILFEDGCYAEVITPSGEKWGVHASGDGDSYNHKIRFELLN